MNKKTIGAIMLLASISLINCNSNKAEETNNENSAKEVTVEKDTVISIEVDIETEEENQISVEEIDQIGSEIENLEIIPIEISTADLRDKIKQKWSKIHYYVQNDKVVKIKTYPYAEISKRTVEFYANENGLVLVVIEDNGEGDKGKSKTDIDKMYYFSNQKLIEEVNNENDAKYSIKESDAEELLSEYNEYIEIFGKSGK